MKLIDWLRKLGILRFGGEAGVYRNARERPLGFVDGEFDSKKNVIEIGKKSETHPDTDKASN